MGHIVPLDADEALAEHLVGRKFAFLARAFREGFPVPAAFAVSTRAHAAWRAEAAWPEGLREEVTAAAGRLGLRLSVRSSAVKEDLAGWSFAGQYRSFLNISTTAELLARVEDCWQSAASDAVRAYLAASAVEGAAAEAPLMAVVLQRMVHASWSGVAFSRDPRQPRLGTAVWIEAVRGTGEDLVSGRRTPWRARVEREGAPRVLYDGGPSSRLPPEVPWPAIAGLLLRLEARLGIPEIDIEWALDGEGRLWLLQLRPITTRGEEATDLPPPGIWTRRMAEDLWGERLEPFLADVMLRHAPRFDLSRILSRLGIAPVRPALAVIHGYLYLNGQAVLDLAGFLPRRLRPPILETLLPAGLAPAAAPPAIPAARRLLCLLRLPFLPLREPACLPGVCLRRASSAMAKLGARLDPPRRPPPGTAAEALAALAFDLETLGRIQENNQWPYFHAAVQLVFLRELSSRGFGLPGEAVLQLIGRKSRNVTLAIEAAFRALAESLRAEPDRAARFAAAEATENLPSLLPPPLQRELDRFLAVYGARSRHRTLLVPRWAEAPEEVLGILQSLVRTPPAPSGRKASRDFRARSAPFLLRGLARRVTRFLDLREELRFLLDRALFRIRLDLLALGRFLGLAEEVFFLRFAELEDLVSGRLPHAEARRLAEKRRRRFESPWEPATFWIEGRPEYALSPERSTLGGIGASPGTATGRAVPVFHPAQAVLRRGDILVARHTDPGWTPLLSIVAGVVTEEGGLLNHCAIVARELGIPTVVGVRGATRIIPEGAWITVDGGSGTVVVMPG